MSKWSSFEKQQLLTESWRKFLKESDKPETVDEAAGDLAGAIPGTSANKMKKAVAATEKGQKMPDDFSKSQVVDVVNFLNTPEGADPKVRAALGAGQADGFPGDEKVSVNQSATPAVSGLSPTQNEISLIKSIGWPLSLVQSVKNVDTGDITGRGTKIVSSGNLVIDGHHRWSSTWAVNPKANINSVDIQFPGGQPLNKLAVAQVAIVGTMGAAGAGTKVPKATVGDGDTAKGGQAPKDNILGKGAEAIAAMIKDMAKRGVVAESKKALLNPEYLRDIVNDPHGQKYLGVKPGMDSQTAAATIINTVSANLAALPKPQGPTRDYMPQFDGGETHVGKVTMAAVIKKLEAGEINYKAPYPSVAKGAAVAKAPPEPGAAVAESKKPRKRYTILVD